ncbi:1184_t:CDS:2, partial [Dentiscutata erythropus]
ESFAIGKRAVVCQDTEMKGEIDIGNVYWYFLVVESFITNSLQYKFTGSGTVLHPQCKILAESGQIIIGSNNIIEENVTIINKQPTPLIIGDENVFEVGCYVEGSKIGNKNIIEAKAKILGTTSLGDNCVIGAVCSTKKDEVIPNNTIIYGFDFQNLPAFINPGTTTNDLSGDDRYKLFISCSRIYENQQSTLHSRHLDYLREVLPKFNHVRIGGANTSSESSAAGNHSKKAKEKEKESSH